MIFMAKRINAKLVMELLGKGMSAREIYKTRRISRQSTKKVLEAIAATGLTWDEASKMDEAAVYDLLFPQQAQEKAAVLDADYDYVHSELQRVGVTQKLLWEEYRDEAGAKGLAAVSYTTFWRGYKQYVTSRVGHKSGRIVEVDWILSTKTDNIQSTCICSAGLRSICMESLLDDARFLWCSQSAEYMYGSLPAGSASSQYSFQSSVIVMPLRLISSST